MRVVASVFALVFSVLPAMADPNDFSRIISFGDSLSDNGNLANNIPPDPPKPPFLPGYFNGRFSNGPTWIELLSNPANSSNPDSSMNRFWGGFLFGGPFNVDGNVNAAIGGAQTVSGFPPSVQTQIATFLSPAAGGAFGPHDLVSIQGGANDFFNFFGANPNPTQAELQNFATLTGVNEASNIAFAIGAGAKTILVSNLPNFGATPSFNGSPATAQGGLFASAVYNTTLDQATQQLAALHPNVNLVQMDWFCRIERRHRQSGGVRLHQCDERLHSDAVMRGSVGRRSKSLPVLGHGSPDRGRP